MSEFNDAKATLEDEFPDWTVWRSDSGRWYATRSGSLTDRQLLSGLAMTVAAETPEGLRVLLREQARPGSF
jgi:hypothetical protein